MSLVGRLRESMSMIVIGEINVVHERRLVHVSGRWSCTHHTTRLLVAKYIVGRYLLQLLYQLAELSFGTHAIPFVNTLSLNRYMLVINSFAEYASYCCPPYPARKSIDGSSRLNSIWWHFSPMFSQTFHPHMSSFPLIRADNALGR